MSLLRGVSLDGALRRVGRRALPMQEFGSCRLHVASELGRAMQHRD